MLNRNQLRIKHYHSQGTSMVEVLVALVIIGIGMLGIASLYVITLQAKTTSVSRMQAVYLANDMAERIRANGTAATSGSYALATTDSVSAPSVTCIQSASAAASPCTAAQMAQTDLYQWDTMLTSGATKLPGNVTRSIAVSGASPTTYQITIGWREPTSGTLTYSVQVQI